LQDDERRSCKCLHPHLLDRISERWTTSEDMGVTTHSEGYFNIGTWLLSVEWHKSLSVGEKGRLLYRWYDMLSFPSSSHYSDTLVCNPSAHYYFVSISSNDFTNSLHENQT
jgi:hypothetical protein